MKASAETVFPLNGSCQVEAVTNLPRQERLSAIMRHVMEFEREVTHVHNSLHTENVIKRLLAALVK